MKTFALDVADEHKEDYLPGQVGDTVDSESDDEEDDDEGLVAEDYEVESEDDLEGETLDDEDEDYEEEPDDEDQYEDDEDEDDDGDGRTPGIDEVIRLVGEHGGAGAEKLVRDLARNSVQNAEVNAMRRELEVELREARQIREELERLANDDDEEESNEEDILENVDPEELKVLQAVLERGGYIKASDLDQEEQEDLAKELEMAGVEMFGDVFGTVDDEGNFVLNEEIKEELAPEFDRIVNNQNLTFRDLFVISNIEQLLEAAMEAGYENGVSSVKTSSVERVSKARKAAKTSSGSKRGSNARSVYDRSELKGKTGQQKISSVMQSIWEELN